LGTRFNALGKAEQTAIAAYVSAEYDKLLFQHPATYVSMNAQADPEHWQNGMRELIASDPKRVREIMEAAHSRSGFTLIEMSIVLTIIGLIVGGILAGQTLIHGAQIQQQITDVQKLKTAIFTFKGKYDCYPGDCPNATTFFGSGVQNGDGDNHISILCNSSLGSCSGLSGWSGSGDDPTAGLWTVDWGACTQQTPEWMYVFQHLSAAGLTSFTPVQLPYHSCYYQTNPVADSIAPSTRFQSYGCTSLVAGPCWTSFMAVGYIPGYTQFPGANMIALGAGRQNSNVSTGINPWDAFAIDTKIDDGMPYSGNVMVASFSGPYGADYCTDYVYHGSQPYTYLTSSQANAQTYRACALYVNAGF
jgi:prepilin-type N-terminal cleavage/methylation domain-containing protein